MPELAPDDVARRLRADVERTGNALVVRFPFPTGAAATALASAAVLGAAGALTAVMLLVLLTTTRTLEVGPDSLRMTRRLFGFGFHRSVATRDVAEVIENPSLLPNASPRLYGVGLRLKDGTPYGIRMRMRDCASARALAQLLVQVLPRA